MRMAGRPSDKDDVARDATNDPDASASVPRHDPVEAALARHGVPPEVARAFARELSQLVRALGPGAGDAVAAAASAVGGAEPAVRHAQSSPQAGPPELDEIQRLMLAFVGELKKLDEALQLLTAYLTRIRDKSAPPRDRILH
jgi:hypothetical protein